MWFLRQEMKANEYLSTIDRTDPALQKITRGLFAAPWYIFYRKFYYKVKVLLFG